MRFEREQLCFFGSGLVYDIMMQRPRYPNWNSYIIRCLILQKSTFYSRLKSFLRDLREAKKISTWVLRNLNYNRFVCSPDEVDRKDKEEQKPEPWLSSPLAQCKQVSFIRGLSSQHGSLLQRWKCLEIIM